MSTPKPAAVIFAKDLARVARFYEQLLSLSVSRAERDHVILEAASFQLIVHAAAEEIARSTTIAQPPKIRESAPIKLVLPVTDIAEARSLAISLGGHVNPSAREWETHDVRACDGHDPEGNVFQLRQGVG